MSRERVVKVLGAQARTHCIHLPPFSTSRRGVLSTRSEAVQAGARGRAFAVGSPCQGAVTRGDGGAVRHGTDTPGGQGDRWIQRPAWADAVVG